MYDIIEKIILDLQKGCNNIHDFNKDLLKNIDNSNKEVLEFITKVLQLRVTNAPKSPETSKTRSNKDTIGIWNPFDD